MPDDNTNPLPQNDDMTNPPADNSVLPPVMDPTMSGAGVATSMPEPPLPGPAFPEPSVPEPSKPEPSTPDPSLPEPNFPEPSIPAAEPSSQPSDDMPTPAQSFGPLPEIYGEVAKKISESQNVLIALSGDPSVDEMCAAIGLSLYLDKLGKRATAIYSGSTPNALEFLKPEETFESTADTLQDFVIALNKEKADHLRYKLDGDYVKIYITPYHSRLSADDLEFSYGDFNVDLVLALDVVNGIDLDAALREHDRIMHDAVIINITTGNPGKFGEIEWSDKKASSVSEMIARMLYSIKSDVEIGKEEATAFLTGIVAATNRFSNAHTTAETMQLSSRLMKSGANQQLISKNITPDVDNELYSLLNTPSSSPKEEDPTKLDIQHGNEKDVDETKEISDNVTEKESTLLSDLKAAEASLAQTGTETTPDLSNQPVQLNSDTTMAEEPSLPEPSTESTTEPLESTPEATSDNEPAIAPTSEPSTGLIPEASSELTTEPAPEVASEPTTDSAESTLGSSTDEGTINNAEKVIAPPSDFEPALSDGEADKYGHMLEEALAELTNPGSATALNNNPATASAPIVSSKPEINGVPEMNFMPPAGEDLLPPPPAPPIDMSASSIETSLPTTPIEPAAPVSEPTPEPLGQQPAMQDQVYRPQASDPGAFKIPGM